MGVYTVIVPGNLSLTRSHSTRLFRAARRHYARWECVDSAERLRHPLMVVLPGAFQVLAPVEHPLDAPAMWNRQNAAGARHPCE